jgi:DNA replication and repair protein RecF
MGFTQLRFFNFRNLKDRELGLEGREVFLVGRNGQGKTNLLEAVHLLSLGSSFREKRDAALIRDPGLAMGLHAQYTHATLGERSLGLTIAPGGGKEHRLNERSLSERRELLSEVLCICFVQQDMDFVTGTPEDKRRFFDQTLILSDLSFLYTLRDYRQVLKSRNMCLRENRDDLLDVYDAQMAGLGLALQSRRAELVQDFDAVFRPLFREITGSDTEVSIRYRPSWEGLRTTDEVVSRLAAGRERDKLVGSTTSGPHRDNCVYQQADRDYCHIASSGQLRLCALVLRMAQACFLTSRTRRLPVLLLDDVLLELDPERKRAFVSRFPPYEQAFFTFLPDEAWQSYRTPDTTVLSVDGGDFLP